MVLFLELFCFLFWSPYQCWTWSCFSHGHGLVLALGLCNCLGLGKVLCFGHGPGFGLSWSLSLNRSQLGVRYFAASWLVASGNLGLDCRLALKNQFKDL